MVFNDSVDTIFYHIKREYVLSNIVNFTACITKSLAQITFSDFQLNAKDLVPCYIQN